MSDEASSYVDTGISVDADMVWSSTTSTIDSDTLADMATATTMDLGDVVDGAVLMYDASNESMGWVTAPNLNGTALTIEESTSSITIGGKELIMLNSWEGILLVIVVCILTVKFIIPRLTFKWWVKNIRDRFYKPIKKEWKEGE